MDFEFQSKHPHRSRSLVMVYEKTEDPTPIVDAMKEIGWNELPNQRPSITGKLIKAFSKAGTGLKGSWTTPEHKSLVKEAEKALKGVGIKNVPYRKLTIQDCV